MKNGMDKETIDLLFEFLEEKNLYIVNLNDEIEVTDGKIDIMQDLGIEKETLLEMVADWLEVKAAS